MNIPTQTPAKLTFEKPIIMNSNGEMISPGISLSIETIWFWRMLWLLCRTTPKPIYYITALLSLFTQILRIGSGKCRCFCD